jgi:hypothetical protein
VLILDPQAWQARQAAHHDRVDAWLGPYLARRGRGGRHPVEDFLFTYYPHRPVRLRRWHPGAGVGLVGAEEHAGYGGYRVDAAGVVSADPTHAPGTRLAEFARTAELLRRTAGRPAYTGCFGLHEWAMVYRIPAADVRHAGQPLRLPPAEIAEVVDSLPVRCTHFDAYRFFTDAARPLNRLSPTRATQPDLEQPGCLHANMDLYKWAYRAEPYLRSELVADCFALAREVRAVDMRASPYDLSDLGYQPIAIETAAGRADYATAQRGFAERAGPLRQALLEAYAAILRTGPAGPQAPSVISIGWAGDQPAGTARRTGDPERADTAAGRPDRAGARRDGAPG